VILDKEGNVVQTIETKANSGRLTKQQKRYYKEGKDVELQLKGRDDTKGLAIKNQKINKKSVEAKMHKVKIDRKTGEKMKSKFKKMK
jgi:hypothetical protein